QVQDVALGEAQVRVSRFPLLAARLIEHRLAEVQAGDARVRRQRLAQREGDVAAAGREVGDGARAPYPDFLYEAVAPESVEPEAQRAVGEVVAFGDAAEHRVHFFWIRQLNGELRMVSGELVGGG